MIAGYLQAVTAGDTRTLQSYVWRYAEASAERPLLQKGEVQGRLAAVESQGGFGAGGLWVEAYRAELVPGGLLFLCWYVNRVTEPRGWLPSAGNR